MIFIPLLKPASFGGEDLYETAVIYFMWTHDWLNKVTVYVHNFNHTLALLSHCPTFFVSVWSFWIEANRQVVFIVCIAVRNSIIKRVWFGIPFTGLTLSHYCDCPKPCHGFLSAYFMLLLCVEWFEVRDDCSLVNIGELSLFNLSFHNILLLNGKRYMYTHLVWFVFIVFNATFSNISAISWRPVLVVEKVGVPGENHQPWASNW